MTDEPQAQLDEFKHASRELESGDSPNRFGERLGKLVKHGPLEKAE